MATRYSVKTEFALVDRASAALNAIGVQGQTMNRALAGSLAAGEQRIRAMGAAAKAAGRAVIGMGAAAAGAGIAIATKQYIDYESEIRKAGALFSDMDSAAADFENRLRGVGSAARAVAAATEFNATDTAAALGSFARAGYDSKRAMELLAPTADLATAAEVSLGEAADIATASLGAMGMAADATNLTHISDVFAKTAASSRTSIQTIFEALQYAGPAWAQAGQSVETLSAAIGMLGNAGIDASSAGTALNAVFTQLAKPAKVKALEEMGVAVQDAAGNFRPFGEILRDVESALSSMGEVERSGVLNAIFDVRGAKAMNILLAQGADAYNNYRTQLEGAGGAAAQMAAAMRESLSNRIAVLQSALTELGFKFVETFETQGGSAITSLTEAISRFDPAPLAQALLGVGQAIASVVSAAWSMRGALIAVIGTVTLYKTIMTATAGAMAAYTAVMNMVKGAQIAYSIVVKGSAAAQAALAFETNAVRVATVFWKAVMITVTAISGGLSVATHGIASAMAALVVKTNLAKAATLIWQGVMTAVTAVSGGLTVAIHGISAAMAVLAANPIVLIITGIIAAVAALIALIVQCHRHWDEWGEKVMTVLSIVSPPLGLLISVVHSLADSWDRVKAAFSENGFVAGIMAIGQALLSGVLLPIENILRALTWIPGVGDNIAGWADAIGDIRNGSVAVEGGEVTSNVSAEAAPVSAAERAVTSYSREETSNNLNISLDQGLKADKYGSVAPAVTVQRGGR